MIVDRDQFTEKMQRIQHKVPSCLKFLAGFSVLCVVIVMLSIFHPSLGLDLPTLLVVTFLSLAITAVLVIILIMTFIIRHNIFNNNKPILYLINHKTLGTSVIAIFLLGLFALDAYILPYANYERFRNNKRPVLMFTSFLLRYKDGGSQPYYGLTYNIFYYHQETNNGTKIGPKLSFNVALPFRDEHEREEVRLRKWNLTH